MQPQQQVVTAVAAATPGVSATLRTHAQNQRRRGTHVQNHMRKRTHAQNQRRRGTHVQNPKAKENSRSTSQSHKAEQRPQHGKLPCTQPQYTITPAIADRSEGPFFSSFSFFFIFSFFSFFFSFFHFFIFFIFSFFHFSFFHVFFFIFHFFGFFENWNMELFW